jgi:MFS family permease
VTEARSYPTPRAAWTMVAMLTVAYIFSFTDRYILGLLIQPIKADLGFTDEQIGLILGPAFAIVYATAGLFLGYMVDRKRRTWIVAAGIALWSLATAASGLARNFWQLFFARMTVGAGESVLSPAAFSMIADSFPPERRGKPIAFYSTALTLGSGIASLIGASVLVWAKGHDGVEVPLVGEVRTWQAVFFAVGLPGLLVSLSFLFLREPARMTMTAVDPDLKGSGMGSTLAYLRRHWATYLSFVSLVAVMTIIAYSHGFLAPTFERTWGWPPEKYAFWNGITTLVLGPATVFGMGWLSDRLTARGYRDGALRIMIAGYIVMLPTAAIPMFMPDAVSAFFLLCVNTMAIGTVTAVGVTALLGITPAQVRGQVVALYYMVISMAGLFLGPTTVGSLATRVYGEENIRYAVATLPILYGIIPLLLIPVMRRLYLAQMDRLGASTR